MPNQELERVPVVEVNRTVTLAKLQKACMTENAVVLDFVSDDGENVRLFVAFPELGGIRLYGEPSGFFSASALPVNQKPGGFNAGEYTVKIVSGTSWRLFFHRAGECFFILDQKNFLLKYQDDEFRKFSFSAPILAGENLTGLGERYNTLNQVGRTVPIYNVDTAYHGHPEEGEKSLGYKNVPLLHSSEGYSIFFNSFYGAVADFTLNQNTAYDFEFNGPIIDLFFWYGGIDEKMDSYTKLTGRPFLPPKWAFEFWAGGGLGCWEPEKGADFRIKFKECIDNYVRMGTVPAAIYGEGTPSRVDDGYAITSPAGVRMLCWNHPGVPLRFDRNFSGQSLNEHYPEWSECDLPNFRDPETGKIINTFWPDYSHPQMVRVIYDTYRDKWPLGLHGAMVDFGEYVEDNWLAYNGMKGDQMHNFYAYCYTRTVHDVFQMGQPNDFVLFARAGCAGTQRWSGFFGGDQAPQFYGLRQAYYGGLNCAVSGFTVWGSDIGSLCGPTSEELYYRWLQFASFSPLMRVHGNHNPWDYGEHAEEVFKSYFWMRENLLDYWYHLAVASHLTGAPIMRMMSVAFPNDSALRPIEDQYMLGNELMICPVLYEGMTERRVLFPRGENWIDLRTGEFHEGGSSATVDAPVEVCPVFARVGAVLPLRVSDDDRLLCPVTGDRKSLLVVPGNGSTRINVNAQSFCELTVRADAEGCEILNPDGYPVDSVTVCGEISHGFADGIAADCRKDGCFTTVSGWTRPWTSLKLTF